MKSVIQIRDDMLAVNTEGGRAIFMDKYMNDSMFHALVEIVRRQDEVITSLTSSDHPED